MKIIASAIVGGFKPAMQRLKEGTNNGQIRELSLPIVRALYKMKASFSSYSMKKESIKNEEKDKAMD